MRGLMLLTFALIATAAEAEEWVVLRPPPESGTLPPGILVDSSSIEILDTGIRRARTKIDFLSRRLDTEKFGPTAVSYMIYVKAYDCPKQMISEESFESYQIDGSVRSMDMSKSPKWYPTPENRAADLTVDFVCGWRPESGSR
jgi:hypothetical protein